MKKPKQKKSNIFIIIILIVSLILLSIFIKLSNLNTKENLITNGNMMWKNVINETEFYSYKFLDDGSCKYSHYSKKKHFIENCTYVIENKKIKITMEDANKAQREYTWKIRMKPIVTNELKFKKFLELKNENKYYFNLETATY